VRLTPSEREVLVSISDDEQRWHIFTDSARLTRRLLAVAARWGITPERLGEGYEFTLPLKAVRFASPPSERRRQLGRESAQKARFGRRETAISTTSAGSGPEADQEAIRAASACAEP
jgi:hypothetical protein